MCVCHDAINNQMKWTRGKIAMMLYLCENSQNGNQNGFVEFFCVSQLMWNVKTMATACLIFNLNFITSNSKRKLNMDISQQACPCALKCQQLQMIWCCVRNNHETFDSLSLMNSLFSLPFTLEQWHQISLEMPFYRSYRCVSYGILTFQRISN